MEPDCTGRAAEKCTPGAAQGKDLDPELQRRNPKEGIAHFRAPACGTPNRAASPHNQSPAASFPAGSACGGDCSQPASDRLASGAVRKRHRDPDVIRVCRAIPIRRITGAAKARIVGHLPGPLSATANVATTIEMPIRIPATKLPDCRSCATTFVINISDWSHDDPGPSALRCGGARRGNGATSSSVAFGRPEFRAVRFGRIRWRAPHRSRP